MEKANKEFIKQALFQEINNLDLEEATRLLRKSLKVNDLRFNPKPIQNFLISYQDRRVCKSYTDPEKKEEAMWEAMKVRNRIWNISYNRWCRSKTFRDDILELKLTTTPQLYEKYRTHGKDHTWAEAGIKFNIRRKTKFLKPLAPWARREILKQLKLKEKESWK